MISGLHICKPGNTPMVGQVKCFQIIPTTAQSGKSYTKIKNATPDKGGQWYSIVSVGKTDYSDAHGNVSFNLDLEPAQTPDSGAVTPLIPTPNLPGVSGQQGDNVRQHMMRAANLYALAIEATDTVIRDRMRRRNIDLHENMAWFQGISTTLFLYMKDHGYIAHMPDREEKPKAEKPEPPENDPF